MGDNLTQNTAPSNTINNNDSTLNVELDDPTFAMLGITPEKLQEAEKQQINLKIEQVDIVDHNRTEKSDLEYFKETKDYKPAQKKKEVQNNIMEDIYNVVYAFVSMALILFAILFISISLIYSLNYYSLLDISVKSFIEPESSIKISNNFFMLVGGNFFVVFWLLLSARKFINKDSSGYYLAITSMILSPIWIFVFSNIEKNSEEVVFGNYQLLETFFGSDSILITVLKQIYVSGLPIFSGLIILISLLMFILSLISFNYFSSYSNSQNIGAYGFITAIFHAMSFLVSTISLGIGVYLNFSI